MTLKLHHSTLEESILSNLNQFSLHFSVLQTVPFMLENKLLFELCAKKTIKATLYAKKRYPNTSPTITYCSENKIKFQRTIV